MVKSEIITLTHSVDEKSLGSEFHITEMEIHHLPSVLEIEGISFKSPWSEGAFLEELRNPDSIHLVALIGMQNAECGMRSSVVGYAVAWVISDELHIGNLAVREDFRRMGIGERLLGELLKRGEGRGVRLATLEVRITNEGAIHLYKKYGFQEIAIRKGYYREDGEDAMVMLLNCK